MNPFEDYTLVHHSGNFELHASPVAVVSYEGLAKEWLVIKTKSNMFYCLSARDSGVWEVEWTPSVRANLFDRMAEGLQAWIKSDLERKLVDSGLFGHMAAWDAVARQWQHKDPDFIITPWEDMQDA